MSTDVGAKREAIERVIRRFETAHNAGDVEAMLACYGASPVYFPQNSPAQVGPDAIRGYQQRAYQAFTFDEHYDILDLEVCGSLAWARGYSYGRVWVHGAGEPISFGKDSGFPGANTLWIFHRESGEWKIHRYIFGADRPVKALG